MAKPGQCFQYPFPVNGFYTGTIKVSLSHTFPISQYYSIHKVFKSHVKPSQADFLYSPVLLKPTAYLLACLLASAAYYLLQLTAPTSEFYSIIQAQRGHVSQKTHVTWQLPTVVVTSLYLRGSVFTGPLLRYGLHNPVVLLRVQPYVCCGRCLAVDFYVGICFKERMKNCTCIRI
jgi:hypothetical protein